MTTMDQSGARHAAPGADEDGAQTDTPTAWLIRAGRKGELAQSFIENGIAAVGFSHHGDLSEVDSRDEVFELIKGNRPESSDAQVRSAAYQLWAIRSEIRRGDLLVTPRRNNSGFALGTVTSQYWYRHGAADMPHAVSVDWIRPEVPRTAVRPDLVRAIGYRSTINLIRGDDAARRLRQLLETGQDPGARVDDATGPMDLTELADELLVEVKFLEDIVSLLMDKGQVILYGPPGTGKTYLARKLAAELAPEESCRALVQFHPSTSYEDFFEGYRPAGTGDDGNVRFELTPGPLARMAELASDSSEQHVMIIDEINRGNLPRVLGELLFLLEYRDESVQTLYRHEKPFSLPDNLWFIGTMNTADRSIALVDAALRRRFHFVPFFPDSGPMAGLLGRWLDRQDEPSWVGRLVDAVNDELKAELDGSHLLLGPSHFMKEYGSSVDAQRERLRRIWEYNIEPFIEDQFFGDPEQTKRFRFDAVMRRNGPAAESDVVASDDGDAPEITRGSEGEHAAADGDAAAEPSPTQPENMR